MCGRTRTGGHVVDFIVVSANCAKVGEVSFFARPATRADIRQMADLAGASVNADSLAAWMHAGTAWYLVEDDTGLLLGFQWIGRSETLPDTACEIATFLRPTPLPPGAAAELFDATAKAARLMRYVWISAGVAAENTPARIYYQNRGFRVYAETGARVLMRYDLD